VSLPYLTDDEGTLSTNDMTGHDEPSYRERLKARREAITARLREAGERTAREAALRKAHTEVEAVDILSMVICKCQPLTNESGVYLLFNGNDRVVYVGQADRVLLRMGGHLDKQFSHAKMVPISDRAKRLSVERRLIELLRPPYNVASKPAEDAEC
jgi:hypothetical protein